jgi:hypothetical protein
VKIDRDGHLWLLERLERLVLVEADCRPSAADRDTGELDVERLGVEVCARSTERSASDTVAAPETVTVTSLVAPSPSRAIIRASSPATAWMASCTSAKAGVPMEISLPPAAPDASRTHMSFVDVSMSTVTRLKVNSTACRRAVSHAPLVRGASVVMTASIVAIFGAIMPLPLAMPPTVMRRPSTSSDSAVCFAKVSVVMIAVAA